MKLDDRYMDRIRGFDLLERLSSDALQALLDSSAELQHFAEGDLIFSQGQSDLYISYLLEGRLERTRNGIFELVIDYDRDRRTRPLDAMAQKPHTLHAASPVIILRVVRGNLERAYLDAAPGDGHGVLEVEDISSATTQDWRTRLLSSQLFSTLAAPSIQSIFDRMVDLSAVKGEDVIRQGEVSGDYYVVQSGTCEVLRNRSGVGRQIHLANLGPGDGFGEEAAISGQPRNATVRMTADGRLMRLAREDFLKLVVKPLVRGVSHRESTYLREQGFALVDVREPEQYQVATIAGAINVPAYLVRTQCMELDRSVSYIICSENVGKSVLGAFHFIERGLDAVYLEVPINAFVTPVNAAEPPPAQPEPNKMDNGNNSGGTGNGDGRDPGTGSHLHAVPAPQDRQVPREEYTDTITGQELADIIDELYHQRKEIEDSDRFSLDESAQVETPSMIERVVGDEPVHEELQIPEELIKGIVHEIDNKLTQYIRQSMAARQEALVEKLREHAGQIERVAQEKVKAHEAQVRAHFEELYGEREKKLRADYERLTGLAHKLAEQKAEIQLTRRRLAEMLQTANRVHQAVYRTGATLVSQVDHLGQMDDESTEH